MATKSKRKTEPPRGKGVPSPTRAGSAGAPPSPAEEVISTLASALTIVDDDAYERARSRFQDIPLDIREPLLKLLGQLDERRAAHVVSRDSIARAIVHIIHDERLKKSAGKPLDQTELAARVFPHATAESAASMVSRKLAALEREGFVRRVDEGRKRRVELGERGATYIQLGKRAEEEYFGVDEAPALRSRLEELVDVVIPETTRQDTSGVNDHVLKHVLDPYRLLCKELLDAERWTGSDLCYARILANVPLASSPRERKDMRAAFKRALDVWSDNDPKRMVIELMVDAMSKDRRSSQDFPQRVAYVGSRLDRGSPDDLLWSRLACVGAPQYRSDHRRRVELLDRAMNLLEGSSARAFTPHRRYVQGFAAHGLGIWEHARRMFERAVEASRAAKPNMLGDKVPADAETNSKFATANALLLSSFERFFHAEGAPVRWSRELCSFDDWEELTRGGWLDRLGLRSLEHIERYVERFEAPWLHEAPDTDEELRDDNEVTKYDWGILRIASDPSGEGAKWLRGLDSQKGPPDLSDDDLRIMLLELQFPLPAVLLRRNLGTLWKEVRASTPTRPPTERAS